jgi:hypothetical protein
LLGRKKNRIGENKGGYYGFLPITNRQRAIPPMIVTGSPADCGVVGVTQTTPHPPGHPFPAGGQENVPPAGHTGGVQTTVTAGAGDGAAIPAETGTSTINRRIRKRTGKYLLSIQAIVRDFIKEIGLPVCGIPGLS